MREIKTASTPIVRFSHQLLDRERFEAFNATGEIPVAFEAKRSERGDIQFNGFHAGTLCVWQTQSKNGFWTRRTADGDLFTLRFTQAGKLLRRHRKGDFVANPSQIIFTPFDLLCEEGTTGPYDSLGATITYDAFRIAQEKLGYSTIADIHTFVPVADAAEPRLVVLRLMIQAIQAHASTTMAEHDLTLPLLVEAFIYQLLISWPAEGLRSSGPSPTISKRGVRYATSFIEANLHRRLTIADIADACEVGIRSLHTSFKAEFGSTPMAFVIDRRFENVHRDLLADDGSGTVSACAFRWGFIHMGQFGREYRRRYGCSPIETLRSKPSL